MSLTFLLLLWAQLTLAQDQWRIVYPAGAVESVWGTPQLTPEQRSQVATAWVWSFAHAPRRVEPERIGDSRRPQDPLRLAVRVLRRPAGKPPADLRLIAAPLEMWQELPEHLLPSWPVPASGKLVIPADAGRRWRLRVAGQGEGSFWLDVHPGQASALLATAPAAGIDLTVTTADGAPLGAVSAAVQEAAARGTTARAWAGLRGNAGRLAAPGLADDQEVSLTLLAQGHAPLLLRGRASALPRQVRLAAGAELAGRVVSRSGAPLPGATVRTEAWATGELPQVFTVQTRTGKDGSWNLQGLPPGQVAVSFSASGFVPLAEKLEVAAGRTDLGRRTLEPGHPLTVQVLNENGEPVPGAEVKAGLGLAATADARGVASLSGLPSAPVELTATAAGHLPGKRRLNPPFAGQQLLVLARSFTVRGRLVEPAGSPVTGGTVSVESASCLSEDALSEDGGFQQDITPGETAELVLKSPSTQELRLRLEPGEPGEIRDLGDLQAPGGLAVTGRVVDAGTREPLPGARVWLPRTGPDGPAVAWAARDLLEARTAEDGRFRLSGLPPAAVVLTVEAAGFARRQLAVDPESRDGAGLDLGTIPLSTGALVRVHLSGEGLETPEEAQGAVARVDLGNRWLEPDMLTAAVQGGEATVPNVPAGTATVSVLAGRKLLCEHEVSVPEGGELDVECRREALIVAGLIRLGGQPARSGRLTWQRPGGDVPARIDTAVSPAGLRRQQVAGLGRPPVEAAVDAEGRFLTTDLAPGVWQVAWTPEQGARTPPLPVEIPAVERFETVLPFPGLALTGTVRDEDGEPAAGARVRELASGTLSFAGADGGFSLIGLSPGKVAVEARHGELASEVVEVELGGGEVPPLDLTLGRREPVRVDVLVTGPDGAPAAGAFVFLEETGKPQRLLTTDTAGRASATIEAPLPASLRAAATSGAAWGLGGWTSLEAARQGLTLPLDGTGTLMLLSSRHRGTPRILSEGGWDLSGLLRQLGAPPFLEPDQPLRLPGLPPGRYSVSIEGSTASAAVTAGSAVEARLD